MKEDIKKYFIIGCLLILGYISYKIVKPYFSALAGSIILAYIFHPIYKKILSKIKSPRLSSFLTCLIIVILIIIPLIIVSNIIIQESVAIYKSDFINKIEDFTTKYTSEDFPYSGIVSQGIFKSLDYIRNAATNFFISLPSGILGFLIAFYTLYFLFLKGENVVNEVLRIIPLKERHLLINNLGKTTFSIVYGLFAVAAIEVIITTIGFLIFGVSSPVLWGLIIGFLALIPFLGPAIVWVPFTLIQYLGGDITKAVGIAVVGIILTTVDTFLRPMIIGEESKMSPVIVLIGILGGLKVFGFIGLLLGPLVLSTLIEIIRIYHNHTK